MRSTPTEMQSMNENDFECLAKTRVNTPPMAKMTDDVLLGRYRIGEELPTIRSECGGYAVSTSPKNTLHDRLD